MARLTLVEREVLERLAAGWRPFVIQFDGKKLEKRGLIRADYGPDKNDYKMYWYITDAGQEVLRSKEDKSPID